MERYWCPRELLPVVEAALAAEGYTRETPLEREVGGARITVMTRGSAVIALHEDPQRDSADIRVYGAAPAESIALLDRLPSLYPPHLPRRDPAL